MSYKRQDLIECAISLGGKFEGNIDDISTISIDGDTWYVSDHDTMITVSPLDMISFLRGKKIDSVNENN